MDRTPASLVGRWYCVGRWYWLGAMPLRRTGAEEAMGRGLESESRRFPLVAFPRGDGVLTVLDVFKPRPILVLDVIGEAPASLRDEVVALKTGLALRPGPEETLMLEDEDRLVCGVEDVGKPQSESDVAGRECERAAMCESYREFDHKVRF